MRELIRVILLATAATAATGLNAYPATACVIEIVTSTKITDAGPFGSVVSLSQHYDVEECNESAAVRREIIEFTKDWSPRVASFTIQCLLPSGCMPSDYRKELYFSVYRPQQ